ncbi:Protein Jade-3 [Trichoplax sp. H2]|nr:Protein Jade-3 [Trichoplax sp. H2]|eukprot:RDD41404.1 Protein Jade-3 [Trichoplax sp. H2]
MPNRRSRKRKAEASRTLRRSSRLSSCEENVRSTGCDSNLSKTQCDTEYEQAEIFERPSINFASDSKPAELFRKDLISAMKLPDSQPLPPGRYITITDTWKQEWEKGVQVPVNPQSLSEPTFRETHTVEATRKRFYRSRSYIADQKDCIAKQRQYDLDETDIAWLQLMNERRVKSDSKKVTEEMLEKSIYALEHKCHEKMNVLVESEKLGIEYDDDIPCDVCQSPFSEEGNEMVFCDRCNVCVHQACYGITVIPDGNWYCEPCRLGIRLPSCIFCPHKSGAMKKTQDGSRWGHVSCALWIPETRMGNPEKMQPITRVNRIPASRWTLLCCLCQEKYGACIQCSVPSCTVSFHVTCAIKKGLVMVARLDDFAPGGVKHICYCSRHADQYNENDDAETICPISDRDQRLKKIREEFYQYVTPVDIREVIEDDDLAFAIHAYWTMKRKTLDNLPLVPKPEDTDEEEVIDNPEQQADFMLRVRQDMEKVRNLCYMVIKREKLRRELIKIQNEITIKRLSIIFNGNVPLTDAEQTWLTDVRNNFEISRKAEDFFYTFATFPSNNTPYLGNLIDLVNNIKVSRKHSNYDALFHNQASKINSCKKENFANYSPHRFKSSVRYDDVSYLDSSPVTVISRDAKEEGSAVSCNASNSHQEDFENELVDNDPKSDEDGTLCIHGEKSVSHTNSESENGILKRTPPESDSLESRVLRNRELTDCNNKANISTSYSGKDFMPSFYRRIFVK